MNAEIGAAKLWKITINFLDQVIRFVVISNYGQMGLLIVTCMMAMIL
jgi:hypothetical protein